MTVLIFNTDRSKNEFPCIFQSRDDALANAVEIQDAEDKDESPESLFKGVQIELAPSETKPYTR